MNSSHGDEKPEVVYDVFLSHNSRDKPAEELNFTHAADRLHVSRQMVSRSGYALDPRTSEALEKSATVASFLGETGKGLWHHQEMQQALNRAVQTRDECRVIPVLLLGAREEYLDSF